MDSLDVDGTVLILAARGCLMELFGQSPGSLTFVGDQELQQAPFQRLNVTLRVGGSVRGSMSAAGKTLRAQICNAVRKSSQDVRFDGPLTTADLDLVTMEVWIQLSSEVIDVSSGQGASIIVLGVDGVEVEQGEKSAYYKPSVALTSKFASAADLLSALCAKANLPREAWKNESCIVRRTSWLHVAETPHREVVSLIALREKSGVLLSSQTMHSWLQTSSGYLVQNQESSGEIRYKYDPFSNRTLKGFGNPVRSSGCAYALAAAASFPGSRLEVTHAAKRAIENILRRKVMTAEGRHYISDDLSSSVNGGKLGTTALLALALLTPAMQSYYKPEASQLMTSIRSQQQADGSLTNSFISTIRTSSQINFFPGQALLACVMYSVYADVAYRDVYRAAFLFYREHFRSAPSTAFVGWQVDVWTRAALLDKNESFAAFVFEQVDWLLRMQLRKPGDLRDGAFTSSSKSANYSTIVYVEAIARAADLAYILGDRDRYTLYRGAVRAGLQFCSLLRLTPKQGIFFASPERAYGGSTFSLTDFTVRADVVQHATTLAIAVLERQHLLDVE